MRLKTMFFAHDQRQRSAATMRPQRRGLFPGLFLAALLLGQTPLTFAKGGDPVAPFPTVDARTGAQYAQAMATDSAGNIIVVGDTNSGANNDYQIAKFKADGTGLVAWSPVTYGATGNDTATAVAVDGNNDIIVTGYTWNGSNNDIHTIKYNGATGAVIWQHTYDAAGSNDTATALAVDDSGDIYVAGYSFNGGKRDDFLIIKYPAGGQTPTWVELYDDTAYLNNDNRIQAIAAGASGIAVTGYSSKGGADFDILTRKYGFDKALIREWRYSSAGSLDDRGVAVKMDGAGNVIVTGIAANAANHSDIYTVKYSPGSATPLWERVYDGNDNDEPKGLWVDSAGDVYITGYTTTLGGTQDFFTTRYDSNGTASWQSILDTGNGATDITAGIAVEDAADGGVFVTGHSTVSGNDDFLTVKYRKDNGTLLWEKTWNGAANKNDRPVGIALAPAGTVCVAGWSDGAAGYDFTAIKYDSGALNAPTGLTARVDSNSAIIVSWADNSSNEETFIIQRKLGEAGTFADITTDPTPLPANTTTYKDTGLIANNYYYYRVRAHNAANGDSYYSNEARALTKVVSFELPAWKYIYNSADNKQDIATAITVGTDDHPVVTGFSNLQEDGVADSYSFDYLTLKLDRANDQTLKWKARYDSGDGGTDMASGVVLDSSGNALVTGTAYLSGGTGSSDDLYTRKVATAGLNNPAATPALMWDHQYGTQAGIDVSTTVAIARDGSNNSVVIGYGRNALTPSSDDIFILKYAADGSRPWPPIVYDSGRNDQPTAVAIDATGNILVTGFSYTTPGSYDWFTAKYNGSTGTLIWSDTYNSGHGDDIARALDLDAAGNVYVTGQAKNAAGNHDFYTIKYDGAVLPANRRIWEKRFNNTANLDDRGVAIRVDPIDGAVVVAGTSYVSATDSDFHLIRYNPADGGVIWDRNFDLPATYDYLAAMTMDSSGYLYLAGNSRNGPDTEAAFDNSSDALSLVYDYEGTFLGAMTFNGAANSQDEANAITVNYQGEAFIAGFSKNAANEDYLVYKQKNNYLLVPAPLTLTPQADYSKVNLTWRENTPGTSFRIERTAGPATPLSSWGEVTAPATGTTNHTDTGLTAGTNYCYRINAIKDSLNSRKIEKCVTTTLAAPSLSPLTVDSTAQITLNWSQVNNNTGYKIERRIGAGAWTDLISKTAGQNSHSDAGLTAGTTYAYRVSTNSAAGYSLPSAELSAITKPAAPALNAPTGITNTQMVLAWNSITGAATYTLQYKQSSGSYANFTDCTNVSTTSCTVTGLTPTNAYNFRVKATNTGGDSAWSNEVTATAALNVPAWAADPNPTNITNNSLTLTWTHGRVTGDALTTYELQKNDITAGSGWVAAGCVTPSLNLNCGVTGLTAGDLYNFRVRAVNAAGASDWVSPVKAVTPALGIPAWNAAPNPSAITDSQMTLGWGAIYGATGYTLEITPQGGSAYTVACPGTTCNATGLSPNKNHFFRVQTNNGGASSAWSATLSGLTLLATPTLNSAAATPASTTQIDLAWSSVTDATGYSIEQADCKNSDSDPSSCNGTTDANYNAWAVKATVGAVTSTTITGLNAGTNYRYRISATGTTPINNSAASTVRHAWTNITPPTLTVMPGSTTSLILSWDQQPGETLYDITKGPDTGSLAAFVTGQAKNIVTKTDNGLSGTGDFCYQIKAYSSAPNAPAAVYSTPKCLKLPPAEPVIALDSTVLESNYTVIEDTAKNWHNGDVWMNQPVVITAGGNTHTRTIVGGASSSFFVSPPVTETINAGDGYVILHAVVAGKASGVDSNGPTFSLWDTDKNWNSIREWQGSKIKIVNSVNANNIGVEKALIGNWNPYVYASWTDPFPSPIVAGDSYQIASFFGTATATGSTTQLTGTGMTANAWTGYYLLMTSGANNGQARKITGNTTTTITTDPFPSASSTGDTYLIAPVAKVGAYFGKATGAGSSTTVLINTDQWWGQDLTNYYLTMTSGNNSGRTRKITGSTATSITVAPPFEVAINPGDSYAVAPAALIGSYFGAALGNGSSSNKLVDTANTWLTDWSQGFPGYPQGYFLMMTSGSNSGYSRNITAMDATSVTTEPTNPFPFAITAGDTYMIGQTTATAGIGKVSTTVAPPPALAHNGKAKLTLNNGSADFSTTAPGYANNYNYGLLSLKDLAPLSGDFDLKFSFSTPSLVVDNGSLAYKYLQSAYAGARFDFQSPAGKNYQTYIYRGRMPRQEAGRAITYTAATKTLADTRTMPDAVTPWKNWGTDQWKDYYIQILSGPNNQLVRKITANTANSITLDNAFPNDPSGVTGNAAASGNSSTKLVDATGTTNWVTNIWVNYLLYMLDGPNAGKAMKIISNDATSVTVEGTGFPAPINGNDSYRISGDSYRINLISGNAANNGSTQSGKNSSNSLLVDASDNIGTTLPPKNWGTNQWAGFYLYMSSGPNIGLFRTITANTANSITVNPLDPFPYLIASNDAYIIYDPNVAAQAVEAYWVQINDPIATANDFQIVPNSDLSGKLRFARTGTALKLYTSPTVESWQLRRQLNLATGNTFIPALFWIYQLGRLPHPAGASTNTTISNFQFTVPAALATNIGSSYWTPEVGHFFRRATQSGNPVEVSWTKIDGATLYQVERCESSDHQNPAGRAENPATCTTFAQEQPTDGSTRIANSSVNTGLVAGYTYRFRVKARYNATDYTAWSSPLWLTVTPPAPVMTAPTAASTTTSQLTPTWTNVNGDNGFKLYWKTSSDSTCSDGSWSLTPFAQAKDAVTYNHSGLAHGTIHCYYITANGPAGPPVTPNSAASNIVWQSTIPDPPAAITFSGITTGKIDLAWSPAPTSGISGYQIERKTGTSGNWGTLVANAPRSPQSYSDTTVAPGTQYYYRITAKANGGNSAVSGEYTATTTPAATALTLKVASAEAIDLSWPVVFGATNYKIERKIGAGSYSEIANLPAAYAAKYCGYDYPTAAPCNVLSAITTGYRNAGLTENTGYCYQVKAWNASGGDSAASPEQCATTSAMPNQNLTASALNSFRIKLAWAPIACSPTPCDTPTGFEIEKMVREGNWVNIATVSGTTLTYIDARAIDPARRYRYRVRAVSGTDFSPYSEASVVTPPYAQDAATCP